MLHFSLAEDNYFRGLIRFGCYVTMLFPRFMEETLVVFPDFPEIGV